MSSLLSIYESIKLKLQIRNVIRFQWHNQVSNWNKYAEDIKKLEIVEMQ